MRGEGETQEWELADSHRSAERKVAFEYPYVAIFMQDSENSYKHEAEWWAKESNVRQRLEK